MMIALSGCSSGLGSETPSQTQTPTPQHTETVTTPTPTETATESPNRTPTPTVTPEPSREEKQQFFVDDYTGDLADENVNVTSSRLDSENETLYLKYRMKDPASDQFTGNERENISLEYAANANAFIKFGYNESWIPTRVNVTAVAPDGYVYETAYLKYEWAEELRNEEIDAFRYLLEYYNTTECGPRHPECK